MIPERTVLLLDGTPGIVRPIVPSDRTALASAFEELASESRIRRFFFNKKKLSQRELTRLTDPDGMNHLALGLAVDPGDGSGELPIAIAHCFRDEVENDLGEIAVVTADLWQSNGAGTELMRSLAAASVAVGIRRWQVAMFRDNTSMRHLLERFGELSEQRDLGDGITELIYEIVEPPEGFPGTSP